MLPEAAGRGQHFQARGHSFSLYGPTLSRTITCLSFFLAVNWLTNECVCLRKFVIELAYAPSTYKPFVKNLTSKRASIYYKKRDVLKNRFFRTTLGYLYLVQQF